MRLQMTLLFLVAVALSSATQGASAQSAYSYPWCSYDVGRSGQFSCYFSSFQQCIATISGIGGLCVSSPYYHPQPAASRQRRAVAGR